MIRMMLAIRSDGQPFGAWMPEEDEPTRAKLRAILDRIVDDPALPSFSNADEQTKARYRAYGKGKKYWIEEPESETKP